MTLRPYQSEAVTAVIRSLCASRSTLLVMATGTGKTQVFVDVARRTKQRALILAHRDELVAQAVARIASQTGEAAGVEKAERHARDERLVVASAQTLRGPRLAAFPRDWATLIVVDECHHAIAATYRAVFDHFRDARVLGVTATPDRTDERAMGEVFDSVAYQYPIARAIADGYLVPPVLRRIEVKGLDLSAITVRAGDLAQGELDEALTQALPRVARPILDCSGDRLTLAYLPGVRSARALAATLNELRPGCARSVDGETPAEERRAMLADHAAGQYQYLVNCMVLTEGYDSPGVACIAMARPTASRSLYAQVLGRGLRTAPGKKDCLCLDFVGASDRLDLVGPEDVLGEADSEDVCAEARRLAKKAQDEQADIAALLRDARAAVAYRVEVQRRDALKRQAATGSKGRKQVPARHVWELIGMDVGDWSTAERFGLRPASEQTVFALADLGVSSDGISETLGERLLSAMARRKRERLASPAQLRLLSRYGAAGPETTLGQAGEMIDRLAANRWRHA